MNKCYRDLIVWQKAMDLVVGCYQLTSEFPKNEVYGLASQLQRAAVSIPSNIAEGNERGSDKECFYHLRVATGSLAELETQIELAFRLGYSSPETRDKLLSNCAEVGRMLHGLRNRLKVKIDEAKNAS